jgi:hypothetical protein
MLFHNAAQAVPLPGELQIYHGSATTVSRMHGMSMPELKAFLRVLNHVALCRIVYI